MPEIFRVVDNSATSPVILRASHGARAIPTDRLGSYVISLAELESEWSPGRGALVSMRLLQEPGAVANATQGIRATVTVVARVRGSP